MAKYFWQPGVKMQVERFRGKGSSSMASQNSGVPGLGFGFAVSGPFDPCLGAAALLAPLFRWPAARRADGGPQTSGLVRSRSHRAFLGSSWPSLRLKTSTLWSWLSSNSERATSK